VVAVGGTTLATAANARGWTETAWIGSNSGCSATLPKPSWQHDTGCSNRMVADVAAVADPNTGVAVYGPSSDTTSSWIVLGGTSVAAPIISGTAGLYGGPVGTGAADIYAHTGLLFDVTSGSTGFCDPTYYCNAGVGYDGPTGLGTPNGSGTP
jgi:subtilase family serine protease